MPGFSFKTNPDGSVTTVVDGEVYSGPDRGKVKIPGQSEPYNPLQDPNLAPVIGLANPISAVMGAGASLGAFGAGVSEFARTGNILRTWDAAGRSYARSLETTPLLGANRVIYNATRNLGVSVLGNLPVSGTRRPGQADSPILGFITPPPKAKSQGTWAVGIPGVQASLNIEDLVTDLVQGAIMFIPVARGVGMAATALKAIPSVARAVSAVGAAGRIPATLGSMAAATEGIGGVSGGLTTAAKVAQVTGGIAARGSQGAVAGAITDFAGFTPGERTDASAIVDLAKTNPQAKAALDWVDKTAGTPIHGALTNLVLSSPNDTEATARFKNAVLGLGVGAAVENVLHYSGLLARSVINRAKTADRVAQEAASATEAPPASQQTVDVAAEPVTPAPAATPPRPAPAPAATIPDPWAEVAAADADVKRLADETATKAAALGSTVSPEMGPVTPERRGGWLPSFDQVQEMYANDILAAPQLLQFKAEGRLSKTGTSGSLKEAGEYNPLFAGVISVWKNPADGLYYVVNGHNRLALAKRSGTEKVLVWEIEAATAEEARAIGAMENIAQGNGTAWDAAKIMRDMSIGAEELKTRGIDLKGPVARDSIPLSRLPQNVFDQGVTGKLSLDKAIALGSEPLDEAVIQDVYARATKGKWSAAKIDQAIQEAKFADVTVDDGGTLPGMDVWFKTTNFNELLDVRTELLKRMREEMVALTSAAREGRKQYLEQAGNVVDVEGSRQAKDKAQAALDLFNRVAGSEGPVRDILKEMAGLVSKKRSAASLADEYLPQIRQAIEDEVKGPRLPLQQAPVAQVAPSVPTAGTSTSAGINPADIAALRDTTGLSPEDAALINQMADLLEGMDQATTKQLEAARGMLDQIAAIEEVLPAGAASTAREEAIRNLNKAFEAPAAAPAPTPAAKAQKAAELPDTRGQGQFFHGAAKEFTLEPGGEYGGTGMNIYGDGLYTTDDLRTGASYQKKNAKAEPVVTAYAADEDLRRAGATPEEIYGLLGRGNSPVPSAERIKELSASMRQVANEYPGTNRAQAQLEIANQLDNYKPVDLKAQQVVYQIKENKPVKFFDLDQPATPDILSKLEEQASGYGAMQELIGRAIDEAGPKASLAKVFDEMRGWSKGLEIPAYEIQEIWNGFIDQLKKDGYGGFTHVGGNLAGRGKRQHQVRIYWDPATSVTLEKVALETYQPTVAAAPVAAVSDEAIAELEKAYPYRPYRGQTAVDVAEERLYRVKKLKEDTTRALEELKAAGPEPGKPKGSWNRLIARDTKQIAQIEKDLVVAQAALDRAIEAKASISTATTIPTPTPATNVTTIPLTETPIEAVVAPVTARPTIEIPAAASRPFDVLDANGNVTTRARTIIDQIQRWTGTGPDEAMAMLRGKGAVLDVSKVPGVDIDQALDDFSMGKTTPATEAVADAYRQFYGPSSQQQRTELLAIAKAVNPHLPNELPDKLKVSPEVAQAARDLIVDVVRKIAGDDIAITFENGIATRVDTGAHGQPGQVIEIGGGYGFNESEVIAGDPVQEAMLFTRMQVRRSANQTDAEYIVDKLMVGAHESMHSIQHRYLSSDQLKVLNTVFAKLKLALAYKNLGNKDLPIERSPQAFEDYYYATVQGQSPAAAMLGFSPEEQALARQDAAIETGSLKVLGQVMEGAIEAVNILDNLTDFVERLYNAFRGRGWTSIRDIFAQAAAGDLKATGAHRGHAFEINDLPGKVNDYMKAQNGDKEWGRRINELMKQGSPWTDFQTIGREEGLMNRSGTGLYSKVPDEPGRLVPEGPENGDWQKRFAELLRQNKEALLSGEITREELYTLNQFQKVESPSGSQVYTAKANELLPGYAAMSNVLPDRPTLTGIPVFNAVETARLNQSWFDRHGFDSKQIMAGLDSVTQGFRSYEHGALNRAMTLADALQQKAQIEAARWLNSVGSTTADPQERLKALVEAANDARRMHVAIANVTRPWGQLGLEMQMPRDYDVTGEARFADEAPQAPAPDQPSVVEEAINNELVKEDGNPDAIYENLTDVLDPELTDAIKTGEITPRAEAAADALAQFINSGGVDPTIRSNTWQQVADLSSMKPKRLQPNKIFRNTTGDLNNPLLMLRVNNIISSGITASTNLLNGTFNLARLASAQSIGAITEGDWGRAMYASQMFGSYLSNISNGFRLAGHAMRAGQSLTNMEGSSIEHFSRLAAKDAQGELLDAGEDAMTGWTINTMNMKQSYAETVPGQALNWAWKLLGTGASRVAIGIDTFNATLAGHSFEHFNHMPRGMQLATERGLKEFSPEAWDYANKYAKARVEASLKDVIINGKTLADAAMESPDAQKFMDAVNFTEKISVALDPRTMAEGMRLGQARGLKDQALIDFARQYVDEGLQANKIADFMVNRSGIAQLGSVPGMTLEALGSAKVIGPVFKLIQPFVRVPSGIIKSALRSTPGNVFVDSFWRDITSENPATRQRAKGELAIGAGAMTLAFAAMATGRIRLNGNGPKDPIAKENWMRDRGMAQSFQYWDEVAGQWSRPYSMAAFEPLTTLFSSMGDYYDVALSLTHEDRHRLGWALIGELMRLQISNQLNKTYFQGINEFYEAALNPSQTFTGAAIRDPFSRFLSRMVSSMVVPYSSAMRAARRQVDPIARSVDPAQTGNFAMDFFYETMGEVANNIPGWSQGLPPRRDWTAPGAPPVSVPAVLGTEFINEDNPFLLGAWQFQPLSSIRVGDSFRNPVQEEMATLHGKGTAFSGPRAADFGPEMRLTPSQLSEYQQVFGTVTDQFGQTWYDRASALVASASYQALPREAPSRADISQRAIQIQLLINEYKEYAKERYIATTAKGGEITKERARQADRKAEAEFNRRYGTPGAQQPDSTEMFLREMNP